jgi:hypothetical protein
MRLMTPLWRRSMNYLTQVTKDFLHMGEPMKFAGTILTLSLLTLTGCPEEPKSCSYNPCAPGCPTTPECEDKAEITDAGQSIQLVCADVDTIAKYWGGTTGPCGPESSITVTEDGNVTKSTGSANLPEGETECADPVVTTYSASSTNSRILINTVCEDFNTNYEAPENLPDGAYSGWGFFQNDNSLASAATDMAISANALDSFMAGLTPIDDSDAGPSSSSETLDAGSSSN